LGYTYKDDVDEADLNVYLLYSAMQKKFEQQTEEIKELQKQLHPQVIE
jgi:hypothetical protein